MTFYGDGGIYARDGRGEDDDDGDRDGLMPIAWNYAFVAFYVRPFLQEHRDRRCAMTSGGGDSKRVKESTSEAPPADCSELASLCDIPKFSLP